MGADKIDDETEHITAWHKLLADITPEQTELAVQQALLLGFQARMIPKFTWGGPLPGRITFVHEGREYTGYSSMGNAALDYLRLMHVPPELIGRLRDGG